MQCETNHKNHDIIYLGDLLFDKEKAVKEINEFRTCIDKVKQDIDEIISNLNNVMNSFEIYYQITKDFVNSYQIRNKNYQILRNISQFMSFKNKIIDEVNKVIHEDYIDNKFNYLMNIHNEMISEIELSHYNKKVFYKNGNIYEGEIKDGMRNGKGVMIYKSGNKYVGEWKDDLKEGMGSMYYKKSRHIYKGEYKNDIRDGKCIYYFQNGNRYEGDFKDKRNGKGIFYYNTVGNIYQGDFKDDKKHGKGIMYYKNGDRTMGDYENDEKIGLHVTLHSNGKVSKEFFDREEKEKFNEKNIEKKNNNDYKNKNNNFYRNDKKDNYNKYYDPLKLLRDRRGDENEEEEEEKEEEINERRDYQDSENSEKSDKRDYDDDKRDYNDERDDDIFE